MKRTKNTTVKSLNNISIIKKKKKEPSKSIKLKMSKWMMSPPTKH